MNISDISGKFLIAVPGLEDPNFRQTVVLVCEHTSEGAFGLVINRILMNTFKPFLKAFDIEKSVVDMPIYYGGPVNSEQGYIIYEPYNKRYGAMRINNRLAVTASRDILCDIAAGRGPEKYLFTLGFAGWTSRQLDEELVSDSWLIAPLDYDTIFKVPVNERWKHAASSIGIDLGRFFCKSGSA